MTVKPVSRPKPVNLRFQVEVSPEYVEQRLEEEGVEVPGEFFVDFQLDEVALPFRRMLKEIHDRYLAVEPYPVLGYPTDEPEEFIAMMKSWLSEAEAEEQMNLERHEALQREEARLQQVFRSEMEDWAPINGSDRLKLAISRGYKANTTYAVERCAIELPGFWVDTARDAEFGERSDPSAAALRLEAAVAQRLSEVSPERSALIVWLTDAPRSLDAFIEESEYEEFEPQEAVLVAEYLGRYDAFLPVDADLHRPMGASDDE